MYVAKNLIPGTYYNFRVQARNAVGFSPMSPTINVLAAKIPDEPRDLANVVSQTKENQIGLTWIKPNYDGGS